MRKIVSFCIAAAALASPSVAPAGHVGIVFENRGLCEAFLAEKRNDARALDEESDGRFNREYRDEYYCEKQDDGSFITVREMI